MVTDDHRGQLLLVGGIAIAIVFLLSIVLTNSLVVTQYTSTPESANKIERVADREEAVTRDLETITGSVRDNTTVSEFQPRLNKSLRNYTARRTIVTGTRSGVYVNGTLNLTASEGNKVENTTSSPGDDFRRPGGSGVPGPTPRPDWDLVRDADRIVAFNATITDYPGRSGTANPFTIIITDRSGDEWKVRAYDENTGTTRRAEVSPPSTGGWNTVCSADNSNDLEIDVVAGTCTIDGTTNAFSTTYDGTLSPPYDVQFENANKPRGSYLLVATGTFPPSSYSGSSQPERYPVNPAIDLNYSDSETGFNRTVLLEDS